MSEEFYVTGVVTRVIKGVSTPEEAKQEFINLVGAEQGVEVYDGNGEHLL